MFWELEPSKTLSTGPLSGVKKSKKRVTLLLTINATGTVKLPPLFINKNKTPKDMKGIDKSKLPVDCYWNEKAWMQVSIWNLYLKKLNELMVKKDKHILLLFDNAPVHILEENTTLTNITLHHLPPNTTAFLQPADSGIINSFKVSITIKNNKFFFTFQ